MGLWWRRLGFAGAWLSVIACFASIAMIAVVIAPQNGTDFSIYFSAAKALSHNPHATIYTISTLTDTFTAFGGCRTPAGWGYIYQPLLAVLLEPLTSLPCGWASVIWQMFSIAAWLCSIAWLARDAYSHGGSRRALAVACIMTFYLPIVNGFLVGQVHLLLLAVFVASFLLVERGHPYTAGALLAFGVFLKYLPIVIIGYYTMRGQWRVALGAIVSSVVMGVAELIVVGPQLVFQSALAPMSGLHVAGAPTVATLVPLAGPTGKIAAALFVAGVLFVSRRIAVAKGEFWNWNVERLGESWALTTMLVISPLIWWHYLTWLLPAFVALLCATNDFPLRQSARTAIFTLVLLAYLLAQTPMLPVDLLVAYLLWFACGALFLYGAGVKPPIRAVRAMRIPATWFETGGSVPGRPAPMRARRSPFDFS